MKRDKLSLWSIVIPIICITLFFSCKKTEEVQTSDLTLEPTEELLEITEPPKENYGIILKPRTPPLPYVDSIISVTNLGMPVLIFPDDFGMPFWAPKNFSDYILYIPEGPPSVYGEDTENNMPPSYRDMSELYQKLKNE